MKPRYYPGCLVLDELGIHKTGCIRAVFPHPDRGAQYFVEFAGTKGAQTIRDEWELRPGFIPH